MQSSTAMLTLLVQDLQKNDKFYNIEIPADATVEELKCLIAIESTIDPERQILTYRQQILKTDSNKIVEHHGIQNNDMINLQVTNLSSADQDLMMNFFSNANKAQAPKLNQSQMFN